MGQRQSTLSYKTAVPAKAFAQAEMALDDPERAPTIIEKRKERLRRLPQELTPTAGVIGSGLTGLLVARELALRGFDVTVVEQDHYPCRGASRQAIGMWSTHHHFEPSPTVRRFARYFARGLGRVGEVVTWDTSPGRVMDRVFARFLYQRLRTKWLPTPGVNAALADMKAETAEVMAKLVADHPELAATVIARHSVDRAVKPVGSRGDDGAAAEVVRDTVTVVDTPRFLDALVEVLQREYGVNFIVDRKLASLQYKLAYDTESIAHANIKYTPWHLKPAAARLGDIPAPKLPSLPVTEGTVFRSDETEPLMEGHGYDVYVLATGGKLMNNTFRPYIVPVTSFGGYSLDIPGDHPLAASFKEPIGRAGPGGMIQWGPIADPTGAGGPNGFRISGLLSLRDRMTRTVNAQWAYQQLLVQAQKHTAAAAASSGNPDAAPAIAIPGGDPTKWLSDEKLRGCKAGFYTRGFACDALPVVTRIGMAENVFAVGGLGDDVFGLAGGAAALLGKMLAKEAPCDLSNPFTIWRFNTVRVVDAPADDRPWQHKWFAMEGWLMDKGADFFAPFFRLIWNFYVEEKTPWTDDDAMTAQRQRLINIPIGPEAPWQRRMRMKELRKLEDAERLEALGESRSDADETRSGSAS